MKIFRSQKKGMERAFLFATLFIFSGSFTIQNANSQCSVNHIPKSICGFDDVIDSYTFNGVTANNLSCNGMYGYSNYSSINGFTAVPGNMVNISASLGAGYNNQGLAVWIDFNNDQYYDASEYVFNAGPDTSLTGSIQIPYNSVATTVAMRVMSMSGNVPMPSDACIHPSGYGETEDYLLNILPINPNNAAVLSIDSPTTFCAGNRNIYAKIANLGITRIDSVQIHWEFNGVVQSPINHLSLLDTLNGSNPSTALILLGNRNFVYGSANSIKVWTSMPNGIADLANFDDTLSTVRKAAIAGNLTIDPSMAISSTNYLDFSSLAYELNSYGICGPINVTVASGTYNDYFSLEKVFGSNSINTILIDGVDSSMVTLSHDGTVKKATFSLLNTNYVTVKNMGIEFMGVNSGSVIHMDESSHNTISNCELRMDTNAGAFELENVRIDGFPSSYNNISNNRIEGGAIGVHLNVTGNAQNSMNSINNNLIRQIFNQGIFTNNQDTIEISHNSIDLRARGINSSYGIQMVNNFNSLVEANYVNAINVGVYLDNYLNSSASKRRFVLTNNMIIADGTGLSISGIDSINIYHNSISANYAGPSISIVNWDTLQKLYDVRNNIFSSNSGLALHTNEPISIFTDLDYNIYYTKAANLAEFNSTSYTDLVALQSAYPSYNISSLQGNPQFASNVDLHIIGILANDVGDNSLGINLDIDGDVRPMSSFLNVDIGADEFNPPSCPMPHSLFAENPGTDSVTIGWIGNSIYFQYIIVPAGNNLSSGNVFSVMNDTMYIGSLSAGTDYDLYVREICARGDSSLWAGPYTFRTAEILDYFEDFETFENGELSHNWESISFASNPSLEWTIDTLSQYSSVSHDHTVGAGGTFAYFKTNFGPGQAILKSAPVYIGPNVGSFNLSFWYYMHGNDIGSLNVYLDTNLITTISGPQQTSPTDPWLFFDTLITGYPTGQYVNLNFEASKGFGVLSEIAIDDIRLDSNLLVGIDPIVNPIGGITIYPNPTSGNIRVIGDGTFKNIEVEILTVSGKSICRFDHPLKENSVINLENFSQGIYFIKLYTKNGISMQKLVLTK